MPRGACRDRSPRSHRLNLLAVVAIVGYLDLGRALAQARADEKLPANLTKFLPDEELESRRLERVQGWALLFAAVVAVALPIYWLHEPSRQQESINYFDKNAAHRGQILFSNTTMPTTTRRSRCSTRTATAPTARAARCRRWSTASRWCGRRRRSTPCSRGSRKTRRARSRSTISPTAQSATSPTSSPTAARAPRCSRGVCPVAARRTSSRSKISSRTCARSS